MTKELQARPPEEWTWTDEQVRIIREQFADGCTDDELAVLLYQAKRRRLDPMLGHLRGIKRWNSQKQREVMAVQTSIDAFRLIAERTGRYGGGPAPVFRSATRANGDPEVIAQVTVRKQTRDGTWHEVSDEARWSEYAQTDRNGNTVKMWTKMPTTMLAKCAEAKTLRKAFPEELGGLYTDDEMGQADNPTGQDRDHAERGPDRPMGTGDQPAREHRNDGGTASAAPVTPAPAPRLQCSVVRERDGARCSIVLNPESGDDMARLICAGHLRQGYGAAPDDAGEPGRPDAQPATSPAPPNPDPDGSYPTGAGYHNEHQDPPTERQVPKPEPIETRHTPDSNQNSRLAAALLAYRDVGATQEQLADWMKRAEVEPSGRGFDRICRELEDLVRRKRGELGPDGLPLDPVSHVPPNPKE